MTEIALRKEMSNFWDTLTPVLLENLESIHTITECREILLSFFPGEEAHIDAFCTISYDYRIKQICENQEEEELSLFLKTNSNQLSKSTETCLIWININQWDLGKHILFPQKKRKGVRLFKKPSPSAKEVKSLQEDEEVKNLQEEAQETPEQTQTLIPKLDNQSEKQYPKTKFFGVHVPQHTMVFINSGSFIMGRAAHDSSIESQMYTRHKVHITKPFWMAAYPCAQKLFKNVMEYNPSKYKNLYNPVENISWYETILFCNTLSILEGLECAYSIPKDIDSIRETSKQIVWNQSANGYRLPTEAEWEYAAKAGEDYLYAGSDDLDSVGWYAKNSYEKPHMVGDKKSNNWGLYDMTGNVFEWVWDCFERFYTTEEQIDPIYVHPNSEKRMYRGGAWNSEKFMLKVSYRRTSIVDYKSKNLGFRIVRPVE